MQNPIKTIFSVKLLCLMVLLGSLSACGCRNLTQNSQNKILTSSISGNKANLVVKEARNYLGTPYKYAGNDKKGIDCSGLTCRAYEAIDVQLPRIAGDQTKSGTSVKTSDLRIGDLVFFKASKKSSKKITHVGIVSSIGKNPAEVMFVHASTSKGVVENNLFSTYWKPLIVEAVRVIR